MDLQRLKSTYERLQGLDQRLTHRVRPRSGGGLTRPSADQLDHQMRELANYTIEIKEIVEDLILAIAARPAAPAAPPASRPAGQA